LILLILILYSLINIHDFLIESDTNSIREFPSKVTFTPQTNMKLHKKNFKFNTFEQIEQILLLKSCRFATFKQMEGVPGELLVLDGYTFLWQPCCHTHM
jgi:hypothetical protein